MAVLVKTIADIVALWEREERIHLYPPFSIEWAIKKPGEDKALLGVMYRQANKADYKYEVWEVGT
ncbi:MAG: hypothetical protein V2A71_02015 [Candidatus Eisenbacteria bacterium]